jgi:hypothetical protein
VCGFGFWGWGFGDWFLGPIPNPQSPIPNPQNIAKNKIKYKTIYLKIAFNTNVRILLIN